MRGSRRFAMGSAVLLVALAVSRRGHAGDEAEQPSHAALAAPHLEWEPATVLGFPRAMLLLMAHPQIAWAERDHGTVLRPRAEKSAARQRTKRIVLDVIGLMGDDDLARRRIATRLNKRHRPVRGRGRDGEGAHVEPSYDAMDPALTRYVVGVVTDSILLAHEELVAPLGPAESDAFVRRASWYVGVNLGLPPGQVFESRADLTAYVDEHLRGEVLEVNESAKVVVDALFGASASRLPGDVRVASLGLVPEQLRRAYGLDIDPADFSRVRARLRTLHRRTPGALRRLAGKSLGFYVSLEQRGLFREATAKLRRLRATPGRAARWLSRRPAGLPAAARRSPPRTSRH